MKKRLSALCLALLLLLMISCGTSVSDSAPSASPSAEPASVSPSNEPAPTPDEVFWQDAHILLEGEDILALNQNPYVSGALLGDGRVLAWGDFAGAGITEENIYAHSEYGDLYDMGMRNITQFWLYQFSNYFLDTDGNLWSTGYDAMGTFGSGDRRGSADDPVLVLENVVSAIGGTRFGGAVQSDSSVWVFGSCYLEDTGTWAVVPPTKVCDGAADIFCSGELVWIHDEDGSLFSLGAQEELLKTGMANPVPMSAGARWEDDAYRWDWTGELFEKGNETPILEDVSYLNTQAPDHCIAVTERGELYVWKHVSYTEGSPVRNAAPALLTGHIRLAAPSEGGVIVLAEDGRLAEFSADGIAKVIG